ncbi:hypothetical protein M9Y10_030748 [Tritrichomonas musculus]|uniref:NADAR domain-containing protein n=1 Tax=Tritrichomonas musculus TaxID=1915356 RepID=A0ABR2H303_9EUKA
MSNTTEGIYTLQDLNTSISNNNHYTFICFSKKEEELGCFSLTFPCEFKDRFGNKYSSLLHFTSAQKALLFNDYSSHKKIISTNNLQEISQISKHITNFDREKWDKISYKFAYEGNLYKFTQNDKLFETLLSSKPDSLFVCCDPNDPKYGIGLTLQDSKCRNPFEWKGHNLLGFQITKVRDILFKATSNCKYVSYAYMNHVPTIISSQCIESIDLISSGITQLNLQDHCYLKRIRASNCCKLTNITIKNMHNLEVIDLLDSKSLQIARITNCPKLTTLDIGHCEHLKKLSEIPSLKYLSAAFCKSLEPFQLTEHLIYADVSFSSINPLVVISHSKEIECFICSNVTMRLSDLTQCRSLKIFEISSSKLFCDSISHKHINLKTVIFGKEASCEGDLSLLNNFYITCRPQNPHNLLDFKPEYAKYQKLLYGPWGVPRIDLTPPVIIFGPCIRPPLSVNQKAAADAILGSLYASAVGDMLGAGTEGLSKNNTKATLPGKSASITWTHPRCRHVRIVRGTATDDTSQSILIMRSIVDSNIHHSNSPSVIDIEGVKIDPFDFGRKLIDWIQNGHCEHKQKKGLGVGSKTLAVSKNRKYLVAPFAAAEEEWRKNGENIFSNGCIMRIASSGCFAFWNEKAVVGITECFCRMTHFDPRCVFSSIAASLLISRYIMWNSGLSGEPSIDKTLVDALKYVPGIERHKKELEFHLNVKSLDELDLESRELRGSCMKTLGCAVWCLRYCESIDEALFKVIRQGGDTDTNAAVVGACLGAKYGFRAIPQEYLDYMFMGEWMYREIVPFMQLMGIEVPHSPFLK